MKDHHLPPAYGFVNGIRLEQEPGSEAVLEAWRKAGYPLGNHTWSHINLNGNTAAAFITDTRKNEIVLQKYMPVFNFRWLRYPYLAEGETADKRAAVRSQLAQAGYRVAVVTMSFGDYAWNEPYARCLAQGDEAAVRQLETTYLQAADDSLSRARSMSHTLGQEIPYVLLMHVGAFDARMLPRLLDLYERRGVSFITLEQAESDPFYRQDVDLSLPSAAPTTLEGALAARHLPVPPSPKMPDIASLCP
jgi:peptidoglycan/xylan/chitin deacetylase (PgdA/CDA1 family)